MTGVVQLSEVAEPAAGTPPPCRAEPERWFDRTQRTSALATCLQCPARRGCARLALDTRAQWGMWAGIWINGRPQDVADRLSDIACSPVPLPAVFVPTADAVDRSHLTRAESCRTPLPQRPAIRQGSVASKVLARSSGHCEVFADGCRVTADTRVSRLPGRSVDEATSAASVFAACGHCAQRLDGPEGQADARRLGHLVDAPSQLEAVPFCWRGVRWVYLGQRGELHEAGSGAAAVRAS